MAACCLLRSLQIKLYNQEAQHRAYLDTQNAPKDNLLISFNSSQGHRLGNISPNTFSSNQESHKLYKDESSTLQEITTLFESGKTLQTGRFYMTYNQCINLLSWRYSDKTFQEKIMQTTA